MIKKIFEYYKIPLLISIFLSITVLALTLEKNALNISLIIAGALLGSFFLDLDYLLYAFFLEPKADFSITLAGHLKNKEYRSALAYIHYHKNDIGDKTLNSALFQVVLAGASLLVVSSSSSYLVKLLVLSAFVNSLYRLAEHYYEGNTGLWFWALKVKPDKRATIYYSAALVAILILSLALI
ncbi:MAG: hypothetical protein WC243_03165 [Patescibacteria group bacterium]|jgi:hypothetical protein